MAVKDKRKYKQPIPDNITRTTPNPATKAQALRYPDSKLWERSLNNELDKIDETGAIRWLNNAEPGIIPKTNKPIPLTLTFAYKRDRYGNVEERKSRASISDDLLIAHFHFNPAHTSAPMIDRVSVRMIIGWTLEHFDITSAFLHERYKFHKPVYIKETASVDGTYKHVNTIVKLVLNLYGNPSATFYYLEGLFKFLRNRKSKINEAQACLVRLKVKQ